MSTLSAQMLVFKYYSPVIGTWALWKKMSDSRAGAWKCCVGLEKKKNSSAQHMIRTYQQDTKVGEEGIPLTKSTRQAEESA